LLSSYQLIFTGKEWEKNTRATANTCFPLKSVFQLQSTGTGHDPSEYTSVRYESLLYTSCYSEKILGEIRKNPGIIGFLLKRKQLGNCFKMIGRLRCKNAFKEDCELFGFRK
jgi:hypothetical protein